MVFPIHKGTRLLHPPDVGFRRGNGPDAIVFALLRPAWLLAFLDRFALEASLGRRGLSTQAFP